MLCVRCHGPGLARPPADRRRYLHITLDRAARLSRLIDDRFELSKLEVPDSAPRREKFSLSELAHDLVMHVQPEADASSVFGCWCGTPAAE